MQRQIGEYCGFATSAPLCLSRTHQVYQSLWCDSRTRQIAVASKRRYRTRNAPVARESRGAPPDPPQYDALHRIPSMVDINLKAFNFGDLQGKVVYVVNVASQDDFTHDNYTLMAQLATEFKDEGFVVLAFPSNWFGQKETWSNEKIKMFVDNYSSDIVVMNKFDYEMNPVLALGQRYFPGEIFWNFHGKFLFSRNGLPIARFDLKTEHETIIKKVRAACEELVPEPEEAREPMEIEETGYAEMDVEAVLAEARKSMSSAVAKDS